MEEFNLNKVLEEFENNLDGKKVAIIGLGVSNLPLLRYMYEKGAEVTVFDDREVTKIPKEVLKELVEEAKRGARVTTEIEMLMKMCPRNSYWGYRK